MNFQDNGANEDRTRSRASNILDAIDALLGIALSAPSEVGDVVEENPQSRKPLAEGKEVDSVKQILADNALLRKQVETVDKLQTQIAGLPSKEEIVSVVLARIPAPKCSCQKENGAAAEAHDPDCLAGIKPC